ncbi:MAG: MoaD/ThiS family protein [Nocardioidaceae bacterium]|nr:MoaD/ThiS family protein [Nocardioidaceae bacterium]MDQ3165482.1 MoaD/ThiS family protein [Actinomycetota bacterium]
MSVTVRIPTILRTYTGGAAAVDLEGAGHSVAALLDSLDAAHPGVRGRIVDERGELRRFVNVYVGNDDVRFAQGLQTSVPEGATVSIIPAVAGG